MQKYGQPAIVFPACAGMIRTCDPFHVKEVRYRCASRTKRVSAYATFVGNTKSSACRQREVDAGKCRGIGVWDVEPALRQARGCLTHAVMCRTS